MLSGFCLIHLRLKNRKHRCGVRLRSEMFSELGRAQAGGLLSRTPPEGLVLRGRTFCRQSILTPPPHHAFHGAKLKRPEVTAVPRVDIRGGLSRGRRRGGQGPL